MSASLKILNTTFGYDAFRGQQQAIIDSVLGGADALVIMPTGGGKSLCYQIPSILREGCGVVISPLIALMQDQVDALRELGIKSHYLNSTQSFEEVQAIENELRNGECDLLYIAPERLLQPRTFNLLKQIKIALFAIDEAHCVSQWGHDFRSDYLQLRLLAEHFASVPRIALTATADGRTQEEISERLALTDAKKYLAGFDRPNIRYQINLKNQPKQQLLRFLKNEHPDDSGIVYCLSRNKTEATAEWLSAQGFTALPYHAGLSHELRARHQQRFLREEKIIIVATIAFGMGIDKPDVRFVAHLDLPKSIEAYYQETGRAGRDGEAANAWMVYGLEDVIKLREMMAQNQVTESNAEYKRIEQQKLEAMLGLCEITTCRRHALLHYFGDNGAEQCGNCDMCLSPVEVWDGTEAAQKAISCAYRSEQRFGVSHLVDVLRGAETERIRQFNHHQLSVYGIGKDLDKQQWRSVYRQLIARGLLQIDFNHYNAVKLAETCRPLLQGKTTIALRKDSIDKSLAGKAGLRQKKSQGSQQYGALWEALRQYRAELAKAQGVPPYVIFHDSTLMEMAENQPQTSEQFARLTGVGIKKQEKYADGFLQVIADFMQKNNAQAESESTLSATVLMSLELFQQGKDAASIAQTRSLSLSTVYNHASQLIRHGSISLDSVIDMSEEDIACIERSLVDHNLLQEGGKLKPVYEALAETYSYDSLRCVYMNFLRKLATA